jgi:hypothetical protein
VLSPLQERVAAIVAGLDEAKDFALAGGAALILRGEVERRTRDLDFFGLTGDAVDADARLFPAEPARPAPTLRGEELAVDKVLAIFGRAEARDFVDLMVLEPLYGLDRLCQLAAEKGPGLHTDRLRRDARPVPATQARRVRTRRGTVRAARERYRAMARTCARAYAATRAATRAGRRTRPGALIVPASAAAGRTRADAGGRRRISGTWRQSRWRERLSRPDRHVPDGSDDRPASGGPGGSTYTRSPPPRGLEGGDRPRGAQRAAGAREPTSRAKVSSSCRRADAGRDREGGESRGYDARRRPGGVSERSKERDWKSRMCRKVHRGFKSLSLRLRSPPEARRAAGLRRAVPRGGLRYDARARRSGRVAEGGALLRR